MSDELIIFSKLSPISDNNSRCDTCVYLVADLSLSVFGFLVVTPMISAFTCEPLWIIASGKCININLNEYHYNGCYDIRLVTIWTV